MYETRNVVIINSYETINATINEITSHRETVNDRLKIVTPPKLNLLEPLRITEKDGTIVFFYHHDPLDEFERK